MWNQDLKPDELKNKLYKSLEKANMLSKKDRFLLWALLSTLIGSAHFSLNQVSKNYGKKVGRNSLAKVLKKFSYIQDKLYKLLVSDIATDAGKRKKILVIIDDTLVNKTGKNIFGVYRWYDHTKGRVIRSICLVTLVLVVDSEIVLIMPWLLTKPTKSEKYKSRKNQEQDCKTKSAIAMISKVVEWLEQSGISKRKIVVEADSWFSSVSMRSFLTQLGVKYRIDSKLNYTVQVPNHEAIKKAKTQTRGRKRTRFVKYIPILTFLGKPQSWSYFYNKDKNLFIYYKQVEVTFKSGGKCLVYAFWSDKWVNPRLILTEVKRKRKATPKLVFFDYGLRWSIETAHKELKQQFGLGKCQCRDPWVVTGYIGLITFSYSLTKFSLKQLTNEQELVSKCPSWADDFHKFSVMALGAIPS